MGLIKAGAGAVGSVFGDQWKEYFYCDALEQDVLVRKGSKRTGKKSSNKGSDNIISNGSVIAVADGQCMLIVDQGRVVELCATPGEFVYDSSSEPSIFAGSLGQSIKDSFSTMAKRFTFGGDTAKDQRVYYVNTKEMGEVLYGTATPIPFRVVVNEELGFKLSVKLRCNGNFTYRVADPILFYTNVCGNVAEDFESETIEGKLKGELMTALQPALAKLSADRVMYYEIPAHTMDVAAALNDELSDIWRAKRGLEVVSFNINSLSIPEDQEKKITEWEENAMTMNQTVAASRLVGAQATAMKDAANNASGAMTGFMGMGMAMNQGGINAQNLYAAGAAAQRHAHGGSAAPHQHDPAGLAVRIIGQDRPRGIPARLEFRAAAGERFRCRRVRQRPRGKRLLCSRTKIRRHRGQRPQGRKRRGPGRKRLLRPAHARYAPYGAVFQPAAGSWLTGAAPGQSATPAPARLTEAPLASPGTAL